MRPNFYAMCGYSASLQRCTADAHRTTQATKSFPSGHSSLSFLAATLLSLHFLRRRPSPGRGLLAAAFYAAAFAVAATRLMDHWHFPGDVACGAAIGIVAGLLADLKSGGRC
jgi:undecaprenyl-diphosphatase